MVNDMKFSDYYFAPGVLPLSVLLGVLLGLLVGLFAGWQTGVLAGTAAAVVLSLLIPLSLYREDVPYAKLKKALRHPFLFDERVRFTVRGGSVTGYFILTEHSMVFLSLDHGEHRMELGREDVKSVILGEDASLNIFLNNTHFIRVLSAAGAEMFRILRENGWAVR